jgi:hypothetical protein
MYRCAEYIYSNHHNDVLFYTVDVTTALFSLLEYKYSIVCTFIHFIAKTLHISLLFKVGPSNIQTIKQCQFGTDTIIVSW